MCVVFLYVGFSFLLFLVHILYIDVGPDLIYDYFYICFNLGKLKLYCKGADTVIFARLKNNQDDLKNTTLVHLEVRQIYIFLHRFIQDLNICRLDLYEIYQDLYISVEIYQDLYICTRSTKVLISDRSQDFL